MANDFGQFQFQVPEIPRIRTPMQVDFFFEGLQQQVDEFQRSLDYDHEVGAALASFGQTFIMHVEKMYYQEPAMIYFEGTVNGNKAKLVQHMNQLNFLLMAIEKESKEAAPRRIGFGE